jgi:hypothetical protein
MFILKRTYQFYYIGCIAISEPGPATDIAITDISIFIAIKMDIWVWTYR